MLSQQVAKQLANAHLRESGSRLVAGKSSRHASYGIWTVACVDPDQPDEMLTGGALVVTDAGEVHPVGSVPGALEELMAELGVERHLGDEIASNAGTPAVPASWLGPLAAEFEKPYWRELSAFVEQERADYDVFPPASETFAALELCSFDSVRVVILGQDPYHAPGQAHGLAFSVPSDVAVPSSLKNIHKQLTYDLGIPAPDHGCLDGWATQGVLLLNTVLTVRSGAPKSHAQSGWSTFTDAVISAVNSKDEPVVFMLWGQHAQGKRDLIDESKHKVLESSHPSGLSAYRGFTTSRPFSEANRFLKDAAIDWSAFRSR